MAAAAQFIGSKISLISKAEIRYEGTLYSLDLQEATISLSKVRSFGTEDRPTERPVHGKDEIYEFIIFRGSDIKGIDVVEPPLPPPKESKPVPPSDPAIIEISQQYHTPGNAAPIGPPMNSQQQQQMSSAYASFSGGSGGSGMSNSKPVEKQHQPFSSTTAIISPLQQQHGNHQVGAGVADGLENRRPEDTRSTSPKPLMQGADNRQRQEGRGRGRGGQNYQNQQQRYNNNYQGQSGSGGYSRGIGGGRRGYGPGGSGRGGSFAQTTKRTTFAEEFDFEKSNEELLNALTNMKIKTEEEQPEEEKEDEVYYSKDNFFDNISCEALERSKGKSNRPDWRAERKLNAETFGVADNRRGGGYYRGGRGFYRGGGGGGFNRGGYNNRGGGGGYYRGGGGGGGGFYNRRGDGGNRGSGGRGRGRVQEEAAATN